MFVNFHAHPLYIFGVFDSFAIHSFFFPLVYNSISKIYRLCYARSVRKLRSKS